MSVHRSVFDTPIFHTLYDIYKHLHSYRDKIPKSQRYTLWQRCENVSLSMLEQLISTSHLQGTERTRVIRAISHNVDLLKVLIRLTHETHAITSKQYLAMQTRLQEAGRMVGGWLKSVAH
ncbi:MAG: four helix bundle protein [Bacteroidota bacterium]